VLVRKKATKSSNQVCVNSMRYLSTRSQMRDTIGPFAWEVRTARVQLEKLQHVTLELTNLAYVTPSQRTEPTEWTSRVQRQDRTS
jgi:hypothetical protein